MSLNYIKDSAVQIPNLSAAGDGVDAIVRYYQNGTDEVKNLLKNECSMIYECSYCRSLFRSIINFVAHKRTICRSLHSTIQAEQLEIAKQSLNGQDKDENVAVSKRNTRNTRSLRRFNPANSVAKHIRPVNVRLERANTNIEVQTLPKLVRPTAKTTIVDGKQVVEELPAGLTIKDRIPENRVVLVMPSENSTRYGEMQLRRRRSAYLKKNKEDGSTRELTGEEIAIVERIPSALPVDFINLRCEDARCVKDSQQPFHQLAELAHHLAIQHQVDYTEASLLKKSMPYINCFLCDVPPFKTLNSLQKHFNAMHSSVRAQHTKYRLEQFNSDSLKRKEAQNYRARSLSPLSDADERGAANDSKQSSEEKTFGTAMEISKKKSAKPGVKPKPVELPKLKYTEEEEHDQRLDAAFALKKWIEATKSDEEENENESEKNEKNYSSTQMKQIIDEEEARKIDQLLNSKAPIEKDNKTTESSDQSLVDEGPSSSMALSRSPRSRKPNKKYEDYHDLVNGSGGSKRSVTATKSSTMTAVREILAKAREAATKEAARKSLEFPFKRKLSNESKMDTKTKFKWKKIKFETPTKTKEVIEEKEKTPVLVKEHEIKDFVLPESIKMNDKQETDGEKEKSGNEKNSGSNSPPLEFNEATTTNSRKIDSSADKPKRNVTPTRLNKGKLPSMLTDRYKEELILYTPRARILKNAEKQKKNFYSEPSRRKQNLNELEEGDGLSMISANVSPSVEKQQQQKTTQSTPARPPPQPKPKDLSAIPIYLTEAQRDLFFKPLKYLFNQNLQDDGLCQCGECGEVLKSVKYGRRHMTSHIRVIRMRCSLCDAGAFYCSDMRIHLMYRYCEKLNLAPEEFISPGTPCMDKERADMLTQLVDPYAPGRIMYSTGKIVSWTNPTAYFPDPKMERNILGPILPGYLSPNASPKKLIRSAILSPKKIRPPQPKEEEKPNDTEKEKPKDKETALEVATPPNEASSSESFSPITSTAKDLNLEGGEDHNYPVETEKKNENEEGNNDVQVEVD